MIESLMLPAGCETLGRRREKTDRSGATNRNIPFQCLRPALAGAEAPARVRRDLALLIPTRATLAAVLSPYETGAIPISDSKAL